VLTGSRRRVAWRSGGGSYQSASDPRIHFGLGEIDRVETIEVTWPSGRVDRYRGLRADTGYLLREGEDEPKPLAGFREFTARPESATNSPCAAPGHVDLAEPAVAAGRAAG